MSAADQDQREAFRRHRGRPVRRISAGPIAAGVALLALLLALLAGPASAAELPKYVSSFGPDGTASPGFENPGAVAVDRGSGAVYVVDQAGILYKFDAAGQPLDFGGSAPYIEGNKINGIAPLVGAGESQVAVNSTTHTIYVTEAHALRAFEADGEAAEFSAGPGAGTSEIPSFGSPSELLGVTVDVNGDIYASDYAGTVSIFTPAGEQVTSFSAEFPANVAVSSTGAVYVNRWHGTVTKFTPSEFPVSALTTYSMAAEPVSPNSSNSVAVNLATDDVYIPEEFGASEGVTIKRIAQYDEDGTLLATIEDGGEGQLFNPQGIAVSDEETIYLVNEPAPENGLPLVKIFAPPVFPALPPTVDSTSASDVSADSATLRAEINPNTLPSTYHFEYGLGDCAVSACASAPAGEVGIGAGHVSVGVSKAIAGLRAGTTYHYRVVAKNSEDITEGPDRTFTTQFSGLGFVLADRRAWEMVSPPNKSGGRLAGSFKGLVQAAADGDGLAYVSLGSIEPDPEGNRLIEPSTVLARRGPEGWRSKDLMPPNGRVAPIVVSHQTEYKLFSPDLSRAMLERRADNPLSPQASERTPYLRENSEPGAYTPLVTDRDVPPGTKFGVDESNTDLSAPVALAGATPDLSHVVLRSRVPLAADAPTQALYQWADGRLQTLSRLPVGEGNTVVEAELGSGTGSLRHAISEDGSRVFWGAGQYLGNLLIGLYVRDTVAEETTRLDRAQSGVSGPGIANPVFQGASADGTVIFFTDSQQLTVDASQSGSDLYRCVIPAGGTSSGCGSRLTDVSAPLPGSGESAEVQGLLPAISEDGSSLSFVAKGVLDAAPNQAGESAVAGQFNLYHWRQGQGVRFIATLAGEDSPDWGVGANPLGQTYQLSAAGSPGGRYLSFMSQRSLSGYDNRGAVSGESAEEVFRYDAAADRLDCISCNPSGARPLSSSLESLKETLVDPREAWSGRSSLAASLPEATVNQSSGESFHQPRAVLDNGRVFFNAADALVPADSNGQWDVYQYEPSGAGDCGASTGGGAIVRTAAGCVSLISSGSAEKEAGLLDASADGEDVFFLTSARLSVTDTDDELDVYDARVDGVPATLPPNTECLGEACQSAPVAPNDPTPASSVFKGAGNLKTNARKRCPKGRRQVKSHGKARCVARKHKRRHRSATRHRRTGQERRAGR